jgi:hypothetical protein
VMIVLAGVLTLFLQRRVYISRRKKHMRADYRKAAGLPLSHTPRRS